MAQENNEGMVNRFHFESLPVLTPTVTDPVLPVRPDGGDLTIPETDTFDYGNADISGANAHVFDEFFSLGKLMHDDETAQYAVSWSPNADSTDNWLFIFNGHEPVIQHNGVTLDLI